MNGGGAFTWICALLRFGQLGLGFLPSQDLVNDNSLRNRAQWVGDVWIFIPVFLACLLGPGSRIKLTVPPRRVQEGAFPWKAGRFEGDLGDDLGQPLPDRGIPV